MEHQHKVEMKK